MDIFHLEELKVKVLAELQYERTPLENLKILNDFFQKVKNSDDPNIFEVYSAEFYSDYFNSISNLSVIGLNPKIYTPIISETKNLLEIVFPSNKAEEINHLFHKINQDSQKIENSLKGINTEEENNSPSFPVIVKKNYADYYYGQIEKFSIKIHKDSFLKENRFLIIPSSEKIEQRLEEQIKISWNIAISYLKNYYKNPHAFHEIVLIFEHKYANIEGYSLGVAITLGFIQELFRFYNTPLKLTLCTNITFTGGFENDKTIKPIGSEIIGHKVETVFFSLNNYFALPDSDLLAAKERLNLLLQEYPKRDLKIISLQDFDDLFTHRQIIDIQKSRVIERGTKFVKNNKFLVSLIFIILLVSIWVIDNSIDNNPNGFQIVGSNLNVINKHGKILWSIKTGMSELDRKITEPYFQKIFDINNDGENEVLIAHEDLDAKDMENQGRLACFNSDNKLIWKYKFRDTIATETEIYKDQYFTRIIDIIKYGNKNVVFSIARHNMFPSAIFMLDAETGQRLTGTLWSQGHFNVAKVGDFDQDGDIEIFAGGINNGLESAFMLIQDVSKMKRQTPSVEQYLFKDIEIGTFDKFIIFQKTDICNLFENRFNGTNVVHYYEENKTYQVGIDEKYPGKLLGPHYIFNIEFDSVWLQIGDDFQFIRDGLVTKGLLNQPFTNEPEYSKILIDGIKEWDGERFVKFNSKL
jgi:hypothetical protein